jgi:hypothetical protein
MGSRTWSAGEGQVGIPSTSSSTRYLMSTGPGARFYRGFMLLSFERPRQVLARAFSFADLENCTIMPTKHRPARAVRTGITEWPRKRPLNATSRKDVASNTVKIG